jgi:glycosyltransferase involved in cell wall biosynthesis
MKRHAASGLPGSPTDKSLPKISVVTPSFNSATTIRDTIESVLEQNYPNLEHLVIDGGSTDGTLDILKEYPHLIWISEKDEGHYHAMNKGVQRATGEIVTILNSDDCHMPGVLLKVGRAFAEHRDWDALFGDIMFVDSNRNEIYRREEALYDYDVLRYGGCGYVVHQALFLRKSTHDKVGYYKHKQYLNCCDYDLIMELGRKGCRVGHLPAIVVQYRYHDHGQSADMRVVNNMARESLLIRKSHGYPGGLWGQILSITFRFKRQFQRLWYRRKFTLISGNLILRKHRKKKTNFTSQILSKLEGETAPHH